MKTSLASLSQIDGWEYPKEPLVIGKDILELLSTSMYVDSMSMYREYIQNAADAVDLARAGGILQGPGRVQISFKQSERTVFIRDNGAGLGQAEFVNQLTALGGSSKRGTNARGFRGVGRLAGLAFCQELIFRSRQRGENTVHELRWDSREVRSLLRSADNSCDLREIIAKTVQTREVPGSSWPEHFFEVELRGMIRHRDDRLLNEDRVSNYLAQVAPVPFHPDFRLGEDIKSFLQIHGVHPGAIQIEVVGRGPVYRPHRDAFPFSTSSETKFQQLTTVYTPARNGTAAAVTWILHHDYPGALSSRSLIEGWRFRCGDIQVGDNTLVQSLFPESRFNAWCVAETHVLDPQIIPNGRRDHFEQNTYYFDLINHLAPQARDIAQRCRSSSIARNLMHTIEAQLSECQRNISIIRKGTIAHDFASKLARKLENALSHLQELSSRAVLNPEQQLRYQQQIRRLTQRVSQLISSNGHGEAISAKLPPLQRSVLREVFDAIYESADDLEAAQRLIDKIVSRLKRIPNSRKKPTKPQKSRVFTVPAGDK